LPPENRQDPTHLDHPLHHLQTRHHRRRLALGQPRPLLASVFGAPACSSPESFVFEL
jgi:hypothetical protein